VGAGGGRERGGGGSSFSKTKKLEALGSWDGVEGRPPFPHEGQTYADHVQGESNSFGREGFNSRKVASRKDCALPNCASPAYLLQWLHHA
jgi:hypothetical protein